METLKKHFETINRQSFVETLSKLCRNFVEVLSKLRQNFDKVSGPYGPIRARFWLKTFNFDENDKIINKNIKIVNLGILKVKTWFGDKDLFS